MKFFFKLIIIEAILLGILFIIVKNIDVINKALIKAHGIFQCIF